MFVPLLASAALLAAAQTPAAPQASERFDSAMRCAGVMAATSSLHAFTGNTEGKARSDRNGRGFITAATRFAQPLGLTEEQLSSAFSASTSQALAPILQAGEDRTAADAAIDRLNSDHDACIALARGWVAEAAPTPAPAAGGRP